MTMSQPWSCINLASPLKCGISIVFDGLKSQVATSAPAHLNAKARWEGSVSPTISTRGALLSPPPTLVCCTASRSVSSKSRIYSK